MKITSLFKNSINTVNKIRTKNYPNLAPLRVDTISFSGKNSDNPASYENFKKLILSANSKYVDEEIIDKYYEELQNQVNYVKENFEEESLELVKEAKIFKTDHTVEELGLYYLKCFDLESLIKVYTNKIPIKRGLHRIQSDEIIDLFPLGKVVLAESGIKSASEFNKYIQYTMQSFNNKEKVYNKRLAHMYGLKIYSNLENKENLAKYAELLHYLTTIENPEETDPSKFLVNEVSEFLNELDLRNFDSFDKKFDYLAPKYNNFEEISDKFDAICDLADEYPDKLDFILKLAKNFPDKLKVGSDEDAQKVYSRFNNIIDYIYSNQNSKDFSEKLPYYMDFISNFDKYTGKILKLIPETNEFSTSEDIFNFMDMLAETKTKTDEIIYLAQNSLVADNVFLDCIIYKEEITDQIATILDISQKDAEYIYLNFANEYNALISEANNKDNPNPVFEELIDKNDVVKIVSETLKKFGGLNGLDFDNYPKQRNSVLVDFISTLGYREIINNKGQVQTNKLANLIGSLQLFDSKEELDEFAKSLNIQKETKSNKKSKDNKADVIKPFAYKKAIETERKIFDNTKDLISLYLNSSESDFFKGRSVLDTYKLYRKIDKSLTAIEQTEGQDKNILYRNIKNILDSYQEGNIFDINLSKKLQELIPDRKQLARFVKRNNINLIASDPSRDEEYIKNYLYILELVKDNEKASKYFAQTDFIKLSKEELTKFFDKYKDKETQKEILEGIANSRIKRLQNFEGFIKKYSNELSGSNNLIRLLNKLPDDMNFQNFKQDFLTPLEKLIKFHGLPVEVDDSNILNIDIKHLKPLKEYKSYEIMPIMDSLFKKEEGKNFISVLPYLYKSADSFGPATKENIISEIAIQESKSPYINIPYFLNLNSGNIDSLFGSRGNKIPNEFVNLLNDTSWFSAGEGKLYNMPLHCRMRFIERFVLPELNDISELYSQETKEKMKKMISEIYEISTSAPSGNISFDTEHEDRLSVDIEFNSNKVKTKFTNDGTLITLFEPKN